MFDGCRRMVFGLKSFLIKSHVCFSCPPAPPPSSTREKLKVFRKMLISSSLKEAEKTSEAKQRRINCKFQLMAETCETEKFTISNLIRGEESKRRKKF